MRFLHALLAAILLSFVPTAVSSPAIEPAEGTWNGVVGYDWSQWPNATHVALDAAQGTHAIWLDDVGTPDLILEWLQLAPGHPYVLRDAATLEDVITLANAEGRGIFWSIGASPRALDLVDEAGSRVASLVLVESSMSLPAKFYLRCHGCATTPQPTTVERTWAASTENVAGSYTADGLVETTTCASRVVSLDVAVTAGKAGVSGTGGGTFTYTREDCVGFSAAGTPTRVRFDNEYRKDTYDDGSYKIYGASMGWGMVVDGADPGLPQTGFTVLYRDGKHDPVFIEVTENGAGGVRFIGTYGAEPFGVAVSTTMAASGHGQNKVRITIDPPADGANHQYTYRFFTGDSRNTGIIGLVWKDY